MFGGREDFPLLQSKFQLCDICYVARQERSMLDDPSIIHILVSYDSHYKGYKLYNTCNVWVVVSCDVEFDEVATCDWEAQEETNHNFLVYFDDE